MLCSRLGIDYDKKSAETLADDLDQYLGELSLLTTWALTSCLVEGSANVHPSYRR